MTVGPDQEPTSSGHCLLKTETHRVLMALLYCPLKEIKDDHWMFRVG